MFTTYQSSLQDHPLLQKALVSVFEDILEFNAEAVRYFRKKFWKTLFESTWNGLRKKIQQISNNLTEHKQLFSFILQLAQSKELKDQSQRLQDLQSQIEEEFGEVQEFRKQAQEDFDRRKREENFGRRREIHKWLNAVDNGTRHADILKKTHPGTGEWLLKTQQFEKWYKPNHCLDPLLWMSGKPGAGESCEGSR